MTCSKLSQRILLIAIAVCLLCCTTAEAKKGGNGGGGGETTPQYNVIDLAPMTRAYAVTEKDASDAVRIAGDGTGDTGYTAAMAAQADAEGVFQVEYLPEPRTSLLGGPGSNVYGETFNRASEARSINSEGDIVGGCDYYDPQAIGREYSEFRATLWWLNMNDEDEYEYVRIDLGLADDSHNYSSAFDINAQGVVVGLSALQDYGNEGFESFYRAMLWRPETGMLDLNDLLPVDSGWELPVANSINDLNQVCGIGSFQGVERAYRFDLNDDEIVAIPVLPGGSLNRAFQINLAGHVVGTSETGQLDSQGNPIFHGFLWKGGGAPIDLGSLTNLGSSANDINNQGAIVGNCRVPTTSQFSEWLAVGWDDGVPPAVALETVVPDKPSWQLQFAWGINNTGWIVGDGKKTLRGKTTWPGCLLVPIGP